MLLLSQDYSAKQGKNDRINTGRSCRRSNQKGCASLTSMPDNWLPCKVILGFMAKIQNWARKSNLKSQENLY